jgi:hypothetical protein
MLTRGLDLPRPKLPEKWPNINVSEQIYLILNALALIGSRLCMTSGIDLICRGPRTVKVVITVDAHDCDNPYDIDFAAEWLSSRGITATFFVPSAMFLESKYRACLTRASGLGHEVGSHGHKHNKDEIRGLVMGTYSELTFLHQSKAIYEDFFGHPPKSFRSPCWCKLSSIAIDQMQLLGYCVDSSSTPGRWRILTSCPYHPAWSRSPRSVSFLRPGLLEIPTSTLLIPAASPTFLTSRRALAVFMVRLLATEAGFLKDRTLVLQFHPDDFNPISYDRARSPLRLRDFVLSEEGGFRFKHYLQATQSLDIAKTTQAIMDHLSEYSFFSMRELYAYVSRTHRSRRQ